MASVVKIKRSSVQGKRPTTSEITGGELALNTRDGKLFSSDGSSVFEIGANVHSLSVGTGGISFANGTFTMPTTDGSSGQVLQTDGSGALTFDDAPTPAGAHDSDGFSETIHFTTGKILDNIDFGSVVDTYTPDPFNTADTSFPIYELNEPIGRTETLDCGSVA
jgi:hypothetical protein